MFPSFSDYRDFSLLGCGSFARVYRAVHIPSSNAVALKIFNFKESETDEKNDFDREVKIHRFLDHPNIACYYGSFSVGGEIDNENKSESSLPQLKPSPHDNEDTKSSDRKSCHLFKNQNAASLANIQKIRHLKYSPCKRKSGGNYGMCVPNRNNLNININSTCCDCANTNPFADPSNNDSSSSNKAQLNIGMSSMVTNAAHTAKCIPLSLNDDIKEKKFVISMEFMRGDTLLNYINENDNIPEVDVIKIFSQIVSVIDYLHDSKNVIHQDLKLENILIGDLNMIKLIDFGLSNINYGLLTTHCASFPYAAPEIFQGQPFSYGIDIWSMGVILYTLLKSHLPFESEDVFALSKLICETEPDYSGIDSCAVDLIQNILKKNPKERFNIKQVLNHPFLRKNPYGNMFNCKLYLSSSFLVIPASNNHIDEKILAIIQSHLKITSQITVDLLKNSDSECVLWYKMYRRQAVNSALFSYFLGRRESKPDLISINLLRYPEDSRSMLNFGNLSSRKDEEQPGFQKKNYFPYIPMRYRAGNLFQNHTFAQTDDKS